MENIETLQQELEQTQLAYQMAVEMSQFKAGFLARTSHEIRSPLSSLIGLHQLILSDLCDSPEEQKEFINQAYNSALKLLKIIDKIVAVSKVEYGTNKLNYESLKLIDIFDEVYLLTHLQAANRNLKLEFVSPESSLEVYADRPRLVQLLVNLVDSGIALMKEGKITVSSSYPAEAEHYISLHLNFTCDLKAWEEESSDTKSKDTTTLEEMANIAQQISISPRMKLLMSKTLLETMGGSLTMLDLSEKDRSLTQIVLTCKKP